MATFGQLLNNESLDRLKQFLDDEVDEHKIAKRYTDSIADDLKNTFGQDTVKVQGTDINIAYRIVSGEGDQLVSFFDLKPYFQASSKAKTSKSGGWYLKVPIGHLASTFRKAYGTKQWNVISHVQFGETAGGTADSSRLQQILSNSGGLNSTPLAYQWKSSNITRVPAINGGGRGSYIQFRTVSDKSDPNSWVVGRKQMNQAINDNTNSEAEARAVASVIDASINRIVDQY